MRDYRESAKEYIGRSIPDMCTFVDVPENELSERDRKLLDEKGYDAEEDDCRIVPFETYLALDAATYSAGWFDTELCGKCLDDVLADASGYLVKTEKYRGSEYSNYVVATGKVKIFDDFYAERQLLKSVSKDGRMIRFHVTYSMSDKESDAMAIALNEEDVLRLQKLIRSGRIKEVEEFIGEALKAEEAA